MGKNLTKPTDNPGGENNSPGTNKGTGKTSRGNSSPTQTQGEDGRKASGQQSQSVPGPTTQNQGTPRLVMVEPPPSGTEPKQRKQRPTGLTYNTKGKTKVGSPSGGPGADSVVLVQSLIQGLFAVSASRLGAHWVLTEEEAAQIATPAANIISKYLDTDKMAKYSDPAALVLALVTITLPRLIITITNKKKEGKQLAKPITEPKREVNSGSGTNGGEGQRADERHASNDDQTNVDELLNRAINSPY